MTTLYQPTYYDIHTTPIYTKDGTEYKFEGHHLGLLFLLYVNISALI